MSEADNPVKPVVKPDLDPDYRFRLRLLAILR